MNKYALVGWHQSSRIVWKTFPHLQIFVPGSLRKWSHNDSESRPVYKHITGMSLPTAIWHEFGGHLLPATADTARASLAVARSLPRTPYQGNSPQIRGDLQWPAWSPDLSPCNFFYGVFWNPVFMWTKLLSISRMGNVTYMLYASKLRKTKLLYVHTFLKPTNFFSDAYNSFY